MRALSWVIVVPASCILAASSCSSTVRRVTDGAPEASTPDARADGAWRDAPGDGPGDAAASDAASDVGSDAATDAGDGCQSCGPLGCCADHCCEIVPSNSADVGRLQQTGLVIGPPNGTFDTTTDCTSSSPLGNCALVSLSASPGVCVCRMDELTIGTLAVTGGPALAILARRSVVISGSLSVAAQGATSGPGASFAYADAASSMNGGSGGSYAGRGGNSGAEAYGSEEIVPLHGGMSGQGACDSKQGGGGGGALQITAGEKIEVAGTIAAGGGGGSAGSTTAMCLGGAGGGSGGGVLLEAPAVTMKGTIAANGGGGGGGSSNDSGAGSAGTDGQASAAAAPGGAGEDDHGCSLYGFTSGGDGGDGAAATNHDGKSGQGSDSVSGCIGGTEYVGAGGGGGGIGRIRINTKTGCVCAGTFSPAPSQGQLRIE